MAWWALSSVFRLFFENFSQYREREDMTNALFCFTLAVTLLLSRILLSNGEIKAAISEILDLAADGKLERVATVLSENADAVNYRNHLGFTPLIMATSNGHLELVKYLLGQRADPNTVENDLWSPLMFAAYKVSELRPLKALI